MPQDPAHVQKKAKLGGHEVTKKAAEGLRSEARSWGWPQSGATDGGHRMTALPRASDSTWVKEEGTTISKREGKHRVGMFAPRMRDAACSAHVCGADLWAWPCAADAEARRSLEPWRSERQVVGPRNPGE